MKRVIQLENIQKKYPTRPLSATCWETVLEPWLPLL